MSKKVTMLVVGEQDLSKLKGQDIRILGEEGFVAALHLDDQEELVIEAHAAQKVSREKRKAARERGPMHMKIDVYDLLPEDLKMEINELKEARYAADPKARKEDELIDSFAEMSLEQLLAVDSSTMSDYVFKELVEEKARRLRDLDDEDWDDLEDDEGE